MSRKPYLQSVPLSKTGIKSWPAGERPRERILEQGVDVLSDAELIAVLLRNGVLGKDAVSLARDLLKTTGGLRKLLNLPMKEMTKLYGLGRAKSASLVVVAEVARRYLREDVIDQNLLSHPEAVMDYLFASMRDKKKEVFKVLFLNKAHYLIDEKNLSEGTLDSAVIYPREVIQAALDRQATALVLVHNHPSGSVEPSKEDKCVTQKLRKACEYFSIEVLDHIIVGENCYFSFCEQGVLETNRDI